MRYVNGQESPLVMYVSAVNGTNDSDCGLTLQKSCKTIPLLISSFVLMNKDKISPTNNDSYPPLQVLMDTGVYTQLNSISLMRFDISFEPLITNDAQSGSSTMANVTISSDTQNNEALFTLKQTGTNWYKNQLSFKNINFFEVRDPLLQTQSMFCTNRINIENCNFTNCGDGQTFMYINYDQTKRENVDPDQNTTVVIQNSVFFNSSAAVIKSAFSYFSITGSKFIKNIENQDATIYYDRCSVDINGSTFDSNEAEMGAIYVYGGVTNVTGTTFQNNKAKSFGGIHLSNLVYEKPEQVQLFVSDSKFIGNSASSGGAISLRQRNDISKIYATIQNSQFEGNKALNDGYPGGGSILVGNLTFIKIQGCSFANNQALLGGSLFIENSPVVSLLDISVQGNNITHNTSSIGGGIYLVNSTVFIFDSTIKNNLANYASGIYCSQSSLKLSNTTLSDNIYPNDPSSKTKGLGCGNPISCRLTAIGPYSCTDTTTRSSTSTTGGSGPTSTSTTGGNGPIGSSMSILTISSSTSDSTVSRFNQLSTYNSKFIPFKVDLLRYSVLRNSCKSPAVLEWIANHSRFPMIKSFLNLIPHMKNILQLPQRSSFSHTEWENIVTSFSKYNNKVNSKVGKRFFDSEGSFDRYNQVAKLYYRLFSGMTRLVYHVPLDYTEYQLTGTIRDSLANIDYMFWFSNVTKFIYRGLLNPKMMDVIQGMVQNLNLVSLSIKVTENCESREIINNLVKFSNFIKAIAVKLKKFSFSYIDIHRLLPNLQGEFPLSAFSRSTVIKLQFDQSDHHNNEHLLAIGQKIGLKTLRINSNTHIDQHPFTFFENMTDHLSCLELNLGVIKNVTTFKLPLSLERLTVFSSYYKNGNIFNEGEENFFQFLQRNHNLNIKHFELDVEIIHRPIFIEKLSQFIKSQSKLSIFNWKLTGIRQRSYPDDFTPIIEALVQCNPNPKSITLSKVPFHTPTSIAFITQLVQSPIIDTINIISHQS
eukprot:gene2457-3034_t